MDNLGSMLYANSSAAVIARYLEDSGMRRSNLHLQGASLQQSTASTLWNVPFHDIAFLTVVCVLRADVPSYWHVKM